MVIEGAEEGGNIGESVGNLVVPGFEDLNKLGTLMGEHTYSEATGVKKAPNHSVLVVVGAFEFVGAQGGGNQWVVRGAKDGKEGGNTGPNGATHVWGNIGIEIVIHMHVERRGETLTIRPKDTGVEGIRVSLGKGGGSGGVRGRGKVQGREVAEGGSDGRVINKPEVLCKKAPGKGDWVKIGWGSVVPKGATGIEDAPAQEYTGMERNKVWVVFQPTEGATDIIITQEEV